MHKKHWVYTVLHCALMPNSVAGFEFTLAYEVLTSAFG